MTLIQLKKIGKGPENVESSPYIYVENREIKSSPDFETVNSSETTTSLSMTSLKLPANRVVQVFRCSALVSLISTRTDTKTCIIFNPYKFYRLPLFFGLSTKSGPFQIFTRPPMRVIGHSLYPWQSTS